MFPSPSSSFPSGKQFSLLEGLQQLRVGMLWEGMFWEGMLRVGILGEGMFRAGMLGAGMLRERMFGAGMLGAGMLSTGEQYPSGCSHQSSFWEASYQGQATACVPTTACLPTAARSRAGSHQLARVGGKAWHGAELRQAAGSGRAGRELSS